MTVVVTKRGGRIVGEVLAELEDGTLKVLMLGAGIEIVDRSEYLLVQIG